MSSPMKRATVIGVIVAVIVIAALASVFLVQPRILGIGEAPRPTKLVIWWNKGYYAEEDLALMQAAQEFERMKGVDVEVSFYTTEDIPKKLIAALEAKSPQT
jgi:ABC-type glycerol-3-phosphate transport system substrate-binding protein